MAILELFKRVEDEQVALEANEVNGQRREVRTQGNEQELEELGDFTRDGSVDFRGNHAAKHSTGGWVAGTIILVNQGLATLAFFGVEVNLVLFLTRILQQNNVDAANNVSKWTGTVYIFSLVGAFLSDAYWGRYWTCAVFQVIFLIGLVLLSLVSHLFLLKPSRCGNEDTLCDPHSGRETNVFFLSIYLAALGYGGYQPNIVTFGADQFDAEDPKELQSKVSFFSYFYLALNLGSLFSNTFLSYFEDENMWALGFWSSAGSAFLALLLFIAGTVRYRHIKPGGNPISRVCQVIVAAIRKRRVMMPPDGNDLFEVDDELALSNGSRKMLHTKGFGFLDRAAFIESNSEVIIRNQHWKLCTVTQVEEVKCVLRLLPIWLCTIIYSVVYTQMASLFVEQGAAMDARVFGVKIPPASMSVFDILSVAVFVLLHNHVLHPGIAKIRNDPKGLTELQRMAIGLIVSIMAMIAAGTIEHVRLRDRYIGGSSSSLSILWQIPQYALIGVSEVFMYVAQLEFFNDQAPEGLKSFASALFLASMSLGNYVSDILVTVVMDATANGVHTEWIPENLNNGHMDRFYFLLAALASVDFVIYVASAKLYKSVRIQRKCEEKREACAGLEVVGIGGKRRGSEYLERGEGLSTWFDDDQASR